MSTPESSLTNTFRPLVYNFDMRTATALILFCLNQCNGETIVHHGIVGHFENIKLCDSATLTAPQCEPGARYCESIGMCTKPGGKCSVDGKGCVDIHWNRSVCVKPANACGGGFCGTYLSLAVCIGSKSCLISYISLHICKGSPPNFEDCRCDVDGDGKCHQVEFVPHHDHGL